MNSAPVVTFLSSNGNLADNKLQQAMEQLRFEKQLEQAGFRKQKGDSLLQVMYANLIWPSLDVRSISVFLRKAPFCIYQRWKERFIRFPKAQEPSMANLEDANG